MGSSNVVTASENVKVAPKPSAKDRRAMANILKNSTPVITQKQKDKWLAALRGGRFKQGRDMLMNEYNEYCCLGVLKRTCNFGNRDPESYGDSFLFKFHEETAEDFAGLEGVLAYLNDGIEIPQNTNNLELQPFAPQSFIYIADFIEKFLPVKES